MMTGEETEEAAPQAPSGRFNLFGFNSRRSTPNRRRPAIDAQAFRVQAEVRTNSLQLWANDSELAKVHKFLKMLGDNAAAHQEDREVKTYRHFDQRFI